MQVNRKDTETRKEEILRAALSLMARHGGKGVSVARISHHIGLVPSAIYRHFSGVQQILDDLVDYIHAGLMAHLAWAGGKSGGAPNRLELLFFRHIELIRCNDPIHAVLFCDAAFGESAARRERFHTHLRRYVSAVAGILAAGQQAGAVDPEADPETLAIMFLGLIQPAATIWRLSEGCFDITGYAKRSWRIFHRLIR